MRIAEMDTLPKTAGVAKLRFLPPNEMPQRSLALRDKDIIYLDREDSRFYPLKNGEQFLFTTTDGRDNRFLYFGGTDENPFLVELHMSAFEYVLDGEGAFFEQLKPEFIRETEAKFKVKTKRQGDIFAIRPYPKLNDLLQNNAKGHNKAEVSVVEKASLFGTRHQFTGLFGLVKDARGSVLAEFGEGLLEAPDHEPLKLEGPHLFRQALYIVRPTEAD